MPRKKTLALPERRMLILMDYVIQSEKYKVDTKDAFLKSIGYSGVNNLWNLMNGQLLQVENIAIACKAYRIDANWFIDESHKVMIKEGKQVDVISALRSTVLMAIDELKNGK